MKMKLETRLTTEVENQLEDISKMELGSETYQKTIDGVVKLTDTIVDLKKAEAELKRADYEYRKELFDQELEIKKQEADQTDRLIKNCLTLAGIVIPIGVGIWANVYNWNKEVDDTMTNSGGKKAMDFLLGFRRK